MKKLLPKRSPVIQAPDLAQLVTALTRETPRDAFQELQHQNQELLTALQEIQTRQTDLARLNRELEDTNRGVVALYAELDERADHLRRADELKSRFLSNMSHEFRSPLNSILALSALLLSRSDGDLSGEQDQQVGCIRRAAQDLLELVNDLLDLAKVEAGKVETKPSDFEAANLFAALRGMLRPLLLNQSVDLVFEDVTRLPRMFSDEGKVSQILRNFISNALKFTERGEVRVSAQMTEENEISFSVADTGIGIAPGDRELTFQDFMQIDHPIQRRVKGTGLGLPLSRKLDQLLGGDVEVRSELGVGSTFTLHIPLKFRATVEDRVVAPVEWTPDPARIPVLVVEDSPEAVAIYRSILKDSAFQLVATGTIREADKLLDRIRPRTIILDIVLRSEDTWGFLARLKRQPGTRDIPVLVASTIEDQAKAYHLGADRYLMKPVDPARLIEDLQTLTGAGATVRVVIIDDEERDRYLLKRRLKNLSVSISEASRAEEGIRMACRLKPDVIFLDLTMPGMTGFEALVKLKQEPAVANIPVVIVTSRVLSDTERKKLMEGAIAIVSKESLDKTDIGDLLSRALRGVPAAARLEDRSND